MTFPQNGFGALAKKIQDSPEEVYGMVRATLRGLVFSLEPRNRDEVLNIVMKQWKLSDRRLAGEMLKFFGRGVSRDMSLKPEGVQLMIDLARRDANVSQPFTVAQVTDFSFLDKARRRTQRAAAIRINQFPIRIRVNRVVARHGSPALGDRGEFLPGANRCLQHQIFVRKSF